MAGPFNLNKHLKAIIGPPLKEHGFKFKGVRLLRDGLDEEIYIQRSQFNAPGSPCTFYLNLYSRKLKGVDPHIRLDFPAKLTIPDYYKEYTQSPVQGRQERFEEFTEEQRSEISRFMESIEWLYSTEDDLVRMLETAKFYFDKIPEFARILDETERRIAVFNFKLQLTGWI
jgi:hypothetical protein